MSALVAPHVHLWTCREYHQMAGLGLFDNQRVELIDGVVVDKRSGGSEHATTVTLAAHALERAFAHGYFTRWQMPIAATENSEPKPDLAVIAGSVRDYTTTHPSTAALVVEVADTSLVYDRNAKAALYARTGVPEYWILNLVNRQL